jgi:hypothetical protein
MAVALRTADAEHPARAGETVDLPSTILGEAAAAQRAAQDLEGLVALVEEHLAARDANFLGPPEAEGRRPELPRIAPRTPHRRPQGAGRRACKYGSAPLRIIDSVALPQSAPALDLWQRLA